MSLNEIIMNVFLALGMGFILALIINSQKRGNSKSNTVWIKPFSKENELLNDMIKLNQWQPNANLEKDIKLLKYGLKGEESVAFELNYLDVPMYILHDIRLEYENLVAQFDFLVVTNNTIFCIESKNFYNDIEIDADGNFSKLITNKYDNVIKKESLYSPVTQNKRHLLVLQKILPKNINIDIKSIVVMTNNKSFIHKENAPKNIYNQVIRVDQLVDTLRDLNENCISDKISNKEMLYISKLILKQNCPITYNLYKKYNITPIDLDDILSIDLDEMLFNELKEYRLKKSKELNIKAFMIFSNAELEDLVYFKPTTKNELLRIRGFGDYKFNNYGMEIIEIIEKYKT